MPICVNPVVDDVLRSILNPASLFELSVHVRSMVELEVAVATRLDGAAGAVVPPDCFVPMKLVVPEQLSSPSVRLPSTQRHISAPLMLFPSAVTVAETESTIVVPAPSGKLRDQDAELPQILPDTVKLALAE